MMLRALFKNINLPIQQLLKKKVNFLFYNQLLIENSKVLQHTHRVSLYKILCRWQILNIPLSKSQIKVSPYPLRMVQKSHPNDIPSPPDLCSL